MIPALGGLNAAGREPAVNPTGLPACQLWGRSHVRVSVCRLLLVAATLLTMGGRTGADSLPAGHGHTSPTSAVGIDSSRPLRVVLFYSPTCSGCDVVEGKALPEAKRRWGPRILVEKRNIDNIEVYCELLKYEDHYHSEENETLKVFVGDRYLAGPRDIVQKLSDSVAEELAKGSVTFGLTGRPGDAGDPTSPVPAEITKRFLSFRVASVAAAGLLDGINPCAFTTIIFFLSLLASLGKSRREMVVVGCVFSAAVFSTYLLLGLGAFAAIKVLSVSHGISAILTYGVAALAFFLAAWSFVDFVRYAVTGDAGTMTLGLPASLKFRIRRTLSLGMRTRNLVVGSASVGCVVALLESVCTGQVYLPTIVFVTRDPNLRVNAIAYLVLYNLMFIAPLLGVFLVAYIGVGSERLGGFLRRHLAAFKLALAILFAGLGVLVLTTA